mmetsp:Transcript_5898/g.22380  ORF Transcript_5898/g.22380 Transcript_5898/m.22380 type:complete len:87 (+) Transcript_5898:1408-1668(+)
MSSSCILIISNLYSDKEAIHSASLSLLMNVSEREDADLCGVLLGRLFAGLFTANDEAADEWRLLEESFLLAPPPPPPRRRFEDRTS